ncbi:hypothetical protein MKX03_013091 [Papaver bracteatum]|nr:hypothetical protein MKX03_013091 [Papaver bracteatum]
MGMQTDKVRFNATLATARRNSVFGAMFDDAWNLQPREVNKEYFIDRNPDCFSVLLDLLGTGDLHIPSNIPEKLLYREAHYYGLLDHVKTAKWGTFDSNRLRLMGTVTGQGPNYCSAMRASPDGGCAVAHGGIVRVYDWMLQEHPPLNLDYRSVSDIGWIDSENIVIGSLDGDMGLFSSSTGDLSHRYELNYENCDKSFTARAICFNSDSKIFASLWDQVTGKQIDFFDSLDGLPLGDADRIQWINGSNCLYVSALSSSIHNNCINLLDFRNKSIVWSTSMDSTKTFGSRSIVDAVPVGRDGPSKGLKVAIAHLGVADLRSNDVGVKWNSDNRSRIGRCAPPPHNHPNLGRSCPGPGSSIRDFSIGGDRLFALHSEKNEFDLWETPSAPII